MTDIFCLADSHGHCEEGHGPDAAIRSPVPLFIIYYLFFILYSFPRPLASPAGGGAAAAAVGVCITVERSMMI